MNNNLDICNLIVDIQRNTSGIIADIYSNS